MGKYSGKRYAGDQWSGQQVIKADAISADSIRASKVTDPENFQYEPPILVWEMPIPETMTLTLQIDDEPDQPTIIDTENK